MSPAFPTQCPPFWSPALPRLGREGHVDAVVNSASLFEHDTCASFSFAAMEKHLRSNTGAAILLAQALHNACARTRAAGQADGGPWSTCWTRSCGTRTPIFSATPCPRPRWKPPTPCWRMALAPRARGGRGAGPHADQPLLSDASLRRCTSCRRWGARPPRRTWPPPCALRWKTSPSPAPRCWWTAAST
jgi:hypothetical protein